MSTARRPGRRPGDAEVTRETILTAARRTFGSTGYERATIRTIAARAGVDPALVYHHFGSKQGLFAAAHQLPDPASVLASVFAGPPEEMGERLTRAYLGFAAGPGSPIVSLLRAATSNDDAARMLREFIADSFLVAAERRLMISGARLRLSLCASHLVGIVIGRTILQIPELAEPDVEDLVTAVSPAIQRYLTGDLGQENA